MIVHNQRKRYILTAVSSYLLLALAWIFLSDQLLVLMVDASMMAYVSTIKGVFFVLATAALFFVALKNTPGNRPVLAGVSFLDSVVDISPIRPRYPAWINYLFAIAMTSAMFAFHQQVVQTHHHDPRMIFFILPIVLSALLGGLGPGLTATLISAAAVAISTPPDVASFFSTSALLIRWAFLIVNGLMVSLLSALLRHSIKRVQINQHLLESVVTGTSDAIFVKNRQGQYLLVNRAAAAYAGKTPQQLLGHTDFELFTSESARMIIDRDQAVMQAGKVETAQEHVQLQGAESLYFLTTKGPTFDQEGRINGIFGIARDVSEQHKNHALLQEREAALKLAQQLAGIGNWSWNLQTDEHIWSDEIYRIYGRPRQLAPLIYPEVAYYFTRDSWQRLAAAVTQCLQDGRAYECSAELVRLDKTACWITARGEAQRDSTGKIIRLSGTVQDITEHKLLEIRLQKSQQQLQLVIDATSDGFWDWDYRSGYIFHSKKYDELIGQNAALDTHNLAFFLANIHADDRDYARAMFEQHLSGNAARIEFDCRLNTSAEPAQWVQVRGQIVQRDENDKPLRIVGTLSNISDKKQTELSLKQRERQLERVIEGADQGYWDWNLQTNDFQVSDRYETMLGYEAGEIDVRIENWPELVHPEDFKLAMISVQSHLMAHAPLHEVEMRCKTKNGDWRWVLSRGRVVEWDQHGQPLIMSGTHTDITERKLLERAQNEAAIVFDSSYEGIMLVDPDNKIVKVNSAFTQITGYAAEEVIGQTPRILSSNRNDPQLYRDLWASLNEHDFWRGEIWNRRKNGEIYPELLSISAVRDASGQIQHYVGLFSDISMIKSHEAELDRVAHYDKLTGIANRLLFSDRLRQAILRSSRNNQACAVCLLDLDGFKTINDRHGHQIGDRLLITITERLQETLRAEDTIARLGGDEFALVFSEIHNTEECTQILDRVLEAICHPVKLDGLVLHISASIGVSLFPDDNADPDTLLRHADQAMYLAKESGKNRYQLFDPESDRKAQLHRHRLEQLQYALQEGQFELFYQPKVDLLDNTVIGVEALIRWQHPAQGLLSPAEFLPYLHGNELEAAFGLWVIETALAQAWHWQEQGCALKISVNISANHLLKPYFYEQLAQSFTPYPELPRSLLELEILESAAIEDMTQAVDILERCRELGVKIALDDFGTGYSSLTYLRKLPIDTLKIDQSFVRDMLIDSDDLGIVESVIKLATVFNLEVIAEGVETKEHGHALRQIGCRYAQGYGIAKPMPSSQIPGWQKSWLATSH
ncbi:EAL domain-containing protein [Chitinibacter sp. FCG-7]|uniref:EAL domain-containing protein n=1 Tax=Chitinibacter mangrovi TaxID=3153927 RepID=A0AAU7F8R0_9NEIS